MSEGDISAFLAREDAMPGRPDAMPVVGPHAVLGTPLRPPWPEGMGEIYVGMGCFWGVERLFWQQPHIHSTQAGYAGGWTHNPSYEGVCSGRTGHAEVVRVIYSRRHWSLDNGVGHDGGAPGEKKRSLLDLFWAGHDPTQGMRQGPDRGTQYRSVLFVPPEELATAKASRQAFQAYLWETRGEDARITTAIAALPTFYYAEPYHQQYLAGRAGGCSL